MLTNKTKFKELGPVKDNIAIIKLEKRICKIIKGLVENKKLP